MKKETSDDFANYCKRYGFSKDLFGITFADEGRSHCYKFVGFNVRFKNRPCIIEDLSTGVKYQFSSGYVKAKLLENRVPSVLMSIDYTERCQQCKNLIIDSEIEAISCCRCILFEKYVDHLEESERNIKMKHMYLHGDYKPFCEYEKGIPTLCFSRENAQNEEDE